MNKHDSNYRAGLAVLASFLVMWMLTGCQNNREFQTTSLKDKPEQKIDGSNRNNLAQKRSPEEQSARQQSDNANATIRILFLGNSHTMTHNVPRLVQQMLQVSKHDEVVYVESHVAGFLDGFVRPDFTAIDSGNWDVVVLQGQKISSSGRYHYSTDAAIKLCQQSAKAGARPILFSEWGRRDIEGESERIQGIYQSIADATNAELAPTGAAWEIALEVDSSLILHAPDGNHSSIDGAFLAASVLFATISAKNPVDLPYLDSAPISESQQKDFHSAAAQAIKTNSETDRE